MANRPEWAAALSELTDEQFSKVAMVKQHCEKLLDHSPRFKFFTQKWLRFPGPLLWLLVYQFLFTQ